MRFASDTVDTERVAPGTGPVESRSLQEPVGMSDSDSEYEDERWSVTIAAKEEEVAASEPHKTREASQAAAADAALRIDVDECPICLDTVKSGFRTPCGHSFCSACLAHALFRNDSCPVCRSGGVHTCAIPTDDCPLCVVGHKPGVVIPNVVSGSSGARVLMSARLATAISLIWCQVTSLSIGTVILAFWMCERGALSVGGFGAICSWVALCTGLAIYKRANRALTAESARSRTIADG